MKRILSLVFGLAFLAMPLSAATPQQEIEATFTKFVAAQNAHDAAAVEALLLDSPDFLWITKGTAIWGRAAALSRFTALYAGTWHLAPEMEGFRVVMQRDDVAQLYVPIVFTIGAAGQPAQDTRFLMNQVLVKTAGGWRISSILPIPVPPPAK